MDQDSEDQESLQIICAGPPYCDLKGDEAVKAQENGCIWCSRVYTEPDGREFIEQPGVA